MANIIIRNTARELVTLPSGVFSAWGGRRVYRRAWTAYIVTEGAERPSKDKPRITLFREKGIDWTVQSEVVFPNHKALLQTSSPFFLFPHSSTV